MLLSFVAVYSLTVNTTAHGLGCGDAGVLCCQFDMATCTATQVSSGHLPGVWKPSSGGCETPSGKCHTYADCGDCEECDNWRAGHTCTCKDIPSEPSCRAYGTCKQSMAIVTWRVPDVPNPHKIAAFVGKCVNHDCVREPNGFTVTCGEGLTACAYNPDTECGNYRSPICCPQGYDCDPSKSIADEACYKKCTSDTDCDDLCQYCDLSTNKCKDITDGTGCWTDNPTCRNAQNKVWAKECLTDKIIGYYYVCKLDGGQHKCVKEEKTLFDCEGEDCAGKYCYLADAKKVNNQCGFDVYTLRGTGCTGGSSSSSVDGIPLPPLNPPGFIPVVVYYLLAFVSVSSITALTYFFLFRRRIIARVLGFINTGLLYARGRV